MTHPLPPPEDVEEWICAIGTARDEECFRRLFSSFAPRIKGFHKRSGVSEQLAEEIAQETLFAVWRKAHLYDRSRAGAIAWIFKISRNALVDAIRRQKHPDDNMVQDWQPTAANPEMEMSCKQQAGKMQAAIAVLPADEASLMRLSFFAGESHGDIARALDLPLGTVKSRLRRAICKVRTQLAEGA